MTHRAGSPPPLTVAAILVLLLAAAVPVAMAQGSSGNASGTSTHQPGTRNGTSPPGPMGGFDVTGRSVQGHYISLNYTMAPSSVKDLRLQGEPVADAIRLGAGPSDAGFQGNVFRLHGSGGEVMIHDAPAMVLRVAPAGNRTGVLDLADGLSVNGSGTHWGITDGSGLQATLLFQSVPTYTPSNRTFTFHGDAVLVTRTLPPLPAASAADRQAIDQAVAAGRVGAEVSFAGHGASAQHESLLYQDLNLSVLQQDPGRVRFQVNSSDSTGRTVLVNLDQSVFPPGKALNVSYFDVHGRGTHQVPISEAPSLQAVLQPNHASSPSYWVLQGNQGTEVLVAFPHFSAHQVEIQSLNLAANAPSVVAGVLAGIVLVALAAGNLARGKRKGPGS